MIFTETKLSGVYLIGMEPYIDNRGSFSRVYCAEEFKEHGITCQFIQDNYSENRTSNTIRGLHYQRSPWGEDKLVRCVAGAVFDVAVDLRPDSRTYLQWFGAELTRENGNALFVPKGVAHGYQTLKPDSALYYKASAGYCPEAEQGIRYDDPYFGICWRELPGRVICSSKDMKWPWLKI